MTIHHKMCTALQEKQGQVLTTQAIKQILLQHDPALNFLSILPGDHAVGVQQGKYCRACRRQPLLKRVGHGIYQVLQIDEEPSLPSLHQQLAHVIQGKEGQELTTAEIKALIKHEYPRTYLASVFPSEHMRNGPCRICSTHPLLERCSRGMYRVLPLVERTAVPSTPLLQSQPRQQLIEWFCTHPHAELLNSPTHLEKRLQTACAPYQRETHLLICALRDRIPFDLKEFDDLVSYDTLIERLTDRLYENWGIAKELGRWAVESWNMAVHQSEIPQAVAETSPAYLLGQKQAVQRLWKDSKEEPWRMALNQFWLQNRHDSLALEMDKLSFLIQQAGGVTYALYLQYR